MTPVAVEQVFLERKGGSTSVLLVLEDEAGGRTRERLLIATQVLADATRQAARQLSYRGVGPARKVRLRVERSGELVDDAGLLSVFLDALET